MSSLRVGKLEWRNDKKTAKRKKMSERNEKGKSTGYGKRR